MATSKPADHDDPAAIDAYIAQFSPAIRAVLTKTRGTIHKAAPKATQRMAYNMPAFRQGKDLIYFAGTKSHLGIYPGAEVPLVFAEKLTGYSTSKGTIRFPYTDPISYDLIAEITQWRVEQLSR